jgi:hemerythrin superfamily protein
MPMKADWKRFASKSRSSSKPTRTSKRRFFYPAMEKHEELREMVRESLREHQQIERLWQRIDNGLEAEDLQAKLAELMETVEHHAEDEEEGKMFPEILAIVGRQELEQIGQRLAETKVQTQQHREAS